MEDNLKNIKNQYYKDLIEKLSGFLYSVQQEDGTYPGETNYGYTFSALFFAYMEDFKNISYEERIKKFIFSYSSQKKNSLFHWEFNNYALLKLQELKPHLIKNIPWKTNRNNPNTNWRL
ncbi:MAG: hypothetical protein B6D55_06135 [Candidatus Omnitrophica bacterium 4484_70.2]|nr:MAG: hypothetical protein B6D55_06135 [Candidatus Omnitrophica bacterium 4484_70.2]